MSPAAGRVQLARAYVLHRYPFRDTSLILEIYARDYGRMSLFARGARGPRARGALLQPFAALLLSWSGRGEAPALTAAEAAGGPAALPASQLMSAFYLNELLLRLTTRHDPQPELFDHYEGALGRLRAAAPTEAALRQFEIRLLELIGYGLNLATEADTGRAVMPEGHYQFQPGVHGVVRAAEQADCAIAGEVLQRLASGTALSDVVQLRQARTLMRAALDHCLEGRALHTRAVARSLGSYPGRETGT